MKTSPVMEVLLISGFLGAGKTTLINHLLSTRDRRGKIAVIVNEAGELGIDRDLISGCNVDMIEIAGGCICCTIRTGFSDAVQEIYTKAHPDFLIAEANGVAQPGEILDILFDLPQSEFIHPRSLITVVDASFFDARKVLASFYDNQIRFADIIILNKVDQVEAGTRQEIETVLRQLNPGARLVPARYCTVEPSLLFETDYGNESRHPLLQRRATGNRREKVVPPEL
ncbi:MAG: GTP-binding protein [Desulfobacteraceae bacterium]|nr:GTP-binding protein [Desulfobacterales bacterium]MBL6967718.1 GTP-binding protein [Desulfobacteraceae bacterium]